MVLAKPLFRRADRSDQPRAQVGFTLHPVVQLALDGVIKQSVHRKVTASRIGSGVTERHPLGMAPIPVIGLRTKRRYLELLLSFHDDEHPELSAYWDCPAKHRFDLFG